MKYIYSTSTLLLCYLFTFFFQPNLQAQDLTPNCIDPDVFTTVCGLEFDLCIDYEELPASGTIDIFVTSNDDLGLFNSCDIKLPSEAALLPKHGEVEQVTDGLNCAMRYTLTDENYIGLDSFDYLLQYIDTCTTPTYACDGKIWKIKSYYYGESGASLIVSGKAGNSTSNFDTIHNLQNGQMFYVDGSMILPNNQTEWIFSFYSNGDLNSVPFSTAQVHTSCSAPIFGFDFGVFRPISGCVGSKKDVENGQCNEIFNTSSQTGFLTRAAVPVTDLSVDTTRVYILITNTGVLPIDFTTIAGRASGKDNLIFWDIENIIDEEYLILQKSTDGQNFTDLMKYGNLKPGAEEYLDQDVNQTVTYYRFKMISINGDISYTRNLSVTNNKIDKVAVKVFPNPVKAFLNLEAESKINTVRIFNINGQLVSTDYFDSKSVKLSTSALELQAGIYYIEVHMDNKERVVEKLSIL